MSGEATETMETTEYMEGKEAEAIMEINRELKEYFIERDTEIDLMTIAVLSREHMVMLGAPGTAKSQLVQCFNRHIDEASYFYHMLMKDTTRDEIFGPLDIAALKEGHNRRKTEGYLPEAHFTFLDETFKASSAVLNMLLAAVNERVFKDDGKTKGIPLISMFGASNELPEEDEGLEAFYDRILIRKIVEDIHEWGNKKRLLELDGYKPDTTITLKELQNIQEAVKEVDVTPVHDDMLRIIRKLNSEGIRVSDRRFKESKQVVQAHAFLNGRMEAQNDDLTVLQYIYWTDPEDIDKVRSICMGISNPYANQAAEWEAIVQDIRSQLDQLPKETNNETIELFNKAEQMKENCNELISKAKKEGKNTEPLERVHRKISSLRRDMQQNYLKLED